jgi:hypothetical protein
LRCAGLIDQYVALQARYSILRQALWIQQQPEVKGSLVQQLSIVERQLAMLRHRMLSYTWFWLNADVSAVDDHTWAQAYEVGREALAQRSLSLAGRGGSTA